MLAFALFPTKIAAISIPKQLFSTIFVITSLTKNTLRPSFPPYNKLFKTPFFFGDNKK